MENLNMFLTQKIEASKEALVKGVQALVEKLGKKKFVFEEATVLTVATIVAVMKVFGMMEEIRLLGILITVRAAERGIEIPEGVNKLFAPAVPPTINERGEFVRSQPAPMPAVRTIELPATKPAPATKQSVTVPARQLNPEIPLVVRQLHSHLANQHSEKNEDWAKKARGLMGEVLALGVGMISAALWGEIFKSLRGGDLRIVDRRDYETLIKFAPISHLERFTNEAGQNFMAQASEGPAKMTQVVGGRLKFLALTYKATVTDRDLLDRLLGGIRVVVKDKEVPEWLTQSLKGDWDGNSNPALREGLRAMMGVEPPVPTEFGVPVETVQ